MLIESEVKVKLNSDTGCIPVHTEIMFQKFRSVSDLEPHVKVAKIGFEKIRLNRMCAIYTAMKQSDLGHMACFVNVRLAVQFVLGRDNVFFFFNHL